MSKSNKLVFFGNERLSTGLSGTSCPTLTSLIKNNYEIAAVVSHYSEGRSRSSRPLEIAEIAKKNNIPLLLPEKLIDIKEQLQSLNTEAAVLVAYGKIIPKEIIEIFPKGIINIGVSIMQLTPEMDAGPVYTQAEHNLTGSESKTELAEKLLELGSHILLETLPEILDGSAQQTPQDNSQATYTNLLTKEDGIVDWNKPADIIERQVRAFLDFPKSHANVHKNAIIITKARVAKDKNDGALLIQCSPGWLEIQELIAPSGRKVTGAEFLRGYKK
jgi:methionyl-tRNA formyltransferase